MATEDPAHSDRRHVRPRSTRIVFVILLMCLTLGAGFVFHFRVHLLWQFEASRFGWHDIPSVPNRAMPLTPVPEGWVRCRARSLEFSLPAEMASNMDRPNNGSLYTFYQGWQAVGVEAPMDVEGHSQFCDAASLLCPTSESFTIPRLRLVCSQASSDDFRWSMTPDQVRWHVFCITTRTLIGIPSEGHTETFFRNDMEGIVHFTQGGAVFVWQSTSGRQWGYMDFRDRRENPDQDWIRAVCQSVRLSQSAAK